MIQNDVTIQNYKKEVLKSKKPVLLCFLAYWCSACFLSKDAIFNFKSENAKKIKVLSIDTDKQEELSMRYEVKTLPTFVLVYKGDKIARLEGKQTKETLEEFVYKFIK